MRKACMLLTISSGTGTSVGRSNHPSTDKQQQLLCPPAVAPKAAVTLPFSASLLTTAGQLTTAGKYITSHVNYIRTINLQTTNQPSISCCVQIFISCLHMHTHIHTHACTYTHT